MAKATTDNAHHLKAQRVLGRDPVLRPVVKTIGPLPLDMYRRRSDFETVCRIITGQQLSTKAAATIWDRAKRQCPRWSAATIMALPESRLTDCGLSGPKASYIQQLAERVEAGDLSFRKIRRMSDEDATEALGSIKGFGPWSVQMFLIFSMGRPDVFSPGDAGIRRAMCELYGLTREQYAERAERIAEPWQPYRSYACRYLWRWLDGEN